MRGKPHHLPDGRAMAYQYYAPAGRLYNKPIGHQGGSQWRSGSMNLFMYGRAVGHTCKGKTLIALDGVDVTRGDGKIEYNVKSYEQALAIVKRWADTNAAAFWHSPSSRMILKPKNNGARWTGKGIGGEGIGTELELVADAAGFPPCAAWSKCSVSAKRSPPAACTPQGCRELSRTGLVSRWRRPQPRVAPSRTRKHHGGRCVAPKALPPATGGARAPKLAPVEQWQAQRFALRHCARNTGDVTCARKRVCPRRSRSRCRPYPGVNHTPLLELRFSTYRRQTPCPSPSGTRRRRSRRRSRRCRGRRTPFPSPRPSRARARERDEAASGCEGSREARASRRPRPARR